MVPEVVCLEPALSVVVRVLNAESLVVEEALVQSVALIAEGDVPVSRSFHTNVDGRVVVHPLPGFSLLRASAEGLESGIWHGRHDECDGEITLVLSETFSAMGDVRGAPAPNALASAVVRVRHEEDPDGWNEREGRFRDVLGLVAVDPSGRWSLEKIPWKGGGAYVFRLEAPGACPSDVLVEVTGPGDSVTVDFDWGSGYSLTVVTEDGDGLPVPDVDVVALWKEGDVRWARTSGKSDAEGHADFPSLKPARYYFRTSGKGLANQAFGPFQLLQDDGPYHIQIQPAAALRGRCMHGELPVEAFSITYWGDNPTGRFTEDFHDSRDGLFEITTAPPGTVHVTAQAPGLATRKAVVTSLPTEEIVEIPLEPTTRGIGRVADGHSGSPLPDAEVQAHATEGRRVLDPMGPPEPVDSSGSFDIEVVPGSGSLSVSAPEHERRYVSAPASGDFGTITLEPLQDAILQLVAREPVPFAEYKLVWDQRSPIAFDKDGRAVIHNVPARYEMPGLWTPEGSRIDIDLEVRPRDPGPYPISVHSGREVTVAVGPPELQDEAEYLRVTYRDLLGEVSSLTTRLDVNEEATIGSVLGDSILVAVLAEDATCLAVQSFSLVGDEPRVEVELNDRVTHLRFVTSDGEPIGGRLVSVRDPNDGVQADARWFTDADGLFELRSIETEILLVRITIDDAHVCGYQQVRLRETTPEDPIPVVYDLGMLVRAQLSERGAAAPGVDVDLVHSGTVLRTATSGDGGRFESHCGAPGGFDLRIVGGGYWKEEHTVSASSDPTWTPIEVRRVGSLRLTFRRNGLPLSNAVVDVESAEYGTRVTDWIQDGRVLSSAPDCRTGLDGALVLEGLPSGPFHWSVSVSDERFEGVADVPPHDEVSLTIDL